MLVSILSKARTLDTMPMELSYLDYFPLDKALTRTGLPLTGQKKNMIV